MLIIHNSWQKKLEEEFHKDYFLALKEFLEKEYETEVVYPKKEKIFQAFELTPFENIKVVILGQDPYHGENQAHGLSFSVETDIKLPPSLRNIYKELASDLNIPVSSQGNLTSWARQGVLLLNTVLTVRGGQANSHKGKGWEIFTDEVIRQLGHRETPIIFVLWGKQAIDKKKLIDTSKHKIIEGPHPSPLSAYRGFFGSRPFSEINHQLTLWGQSPIDWSIEK